MKNVLVKKLENKSIAWFNNSNSYLIFEPIVSDVILKIDKNISVEEIELWVSKKIKAPEKKIHQFVQDIFSLYYENNTIKKEININLSNYKLPKKFYSQKKYIINNFIFHIHSENKYIEDLIHPVFSHLEVQNQNKSHFTYQVFEYQNSIVFLVNNQLIGNWKKEESHVLQGKISMHLLIDCYKKPEENWMGVFHASAISNKEEAMLFLGDSGNGKSTSLALLNANGFNCIADDFVPIDDQKNIRTYPAAISIKKKSVKPLLPFYPELENSIEHDLKRLNKIVRYLPPKKINYDLKLKCKALIFIKFNPQVELEVQSISKVDAFQQLIPDSWISPLEKNVEIFLEWFLKLPAYQLTYSNNYKMIETVSKIFNDEL